MIIGRLARLGAVLALAVATSLATVAPASARTTHAPGTSSLAALLAADGSGFDHNSRDYDILDNAVTAVLTAKPPSCPPIRPSVASPTT
jgi:hypothetical protein